MGPLDVDTTVRGNETHLLMTKYYPRSQVPLFQPWDRGQQYLKLLLFAGFQIAVAQQNRRVDIYSF